MSDRLSRREQLIIRSLCERPEVPKARHLIGQAVPHELHPQRLFGFPRHALVGAGEVGHFVPQYGREHRTLERGAGTRFLEQLTLLECR
jgi:hypothetical protein